MTRGKLTCRILKDIRKQIAEANDIDYLTSECQYRGECSGTCPKCEAEVLYLSEQLDARRQMGKSVVLTGLSVGLLASSLSISSCSSESKQNNRVETILLEDKPLLGEAIESNIEETDDSILDGELPEPVQNSLKVTELLVAGNPNPVIKGVYDLNYEDGPKFPGGNKILEKIVANELKKIEFKNHLSFSVEAWLVIGANGKVKSIHKRGYCCASNYWDRIDSIFMNLPVFDPGIYKDKPVDSWYLVYGYCDLEEKDEEITKLEEGNKIMEDTIDVVEDVVEDSIINIIKINNSAE